MDERFGIQDFDYYYYYLIIIVIILVFLMFSWCPNRVLGFQDSFHMNWLMIDSCGVYVVGAIVVELCV